MNDFHELRTQLAQILPLTDLQSIHHLLAKIEAHSVSKSEYDRLASKWKKRKRLDLGLAVLGIVLTFVGFWLNDHQRRRAVDASHVNLPVIAKLANDGDWKLAKELLAQGLSIAPGDPTLVQLDVHLKADEAVQSGVVADGLIPYLLHYARQHPSDAKLRVRIAQLYHLRGFHAEAITWGQEGYRLSIAIHDDALGAAAEQVMGTSSIAIGRTDDAIRHLTHAASIYCGRKDGQKCAVSLNELARLSFFQENYLPCLEYLAESERHDTSSRNVASVALLRGEAQMALGKLSDAAATLQTATDAFERVSDVRGVVYSLAVRGQVASRLGQCATARTLADEAVAGARRGKIGELIGQVFGLSSEVAERCNAPADAYTAAFAALLVAQHVRQPPLIEFATGEVTRLRSQVPAADIAALENKGRALFESVGLAR